MTVHCPEENDRRVVGGVVVEAVKDAIILHSQRLDADALIEMWGALNQRASLGLVSSRLPSLLGKLLQYFAFVLVSGRISELFCIRHALSRESPTLCASIAHRFQDSLAAAPRCPQLVDPTWSVLISFETSCTSNAYTLQ